MAASRVRADYPKLEQIARSFSQQSDTTRRSLDSLKSKMSNLQSGNWLGKNADKFYGEMNASVFPALKRLVSALEQASSVTKKISQVIKQAEGDAAAVFKGQGSGGADGQGQAGQPAKSGGGFWSQVGGFFSGVWEGAKGMVEGLFHAVTHPIDTLKGLAYGITHPGELWDALKKPYVDDWNSGNYGRAIGRGAFEVAMLLIPGIGEAKAVGKGAEVAGTAGKLAKVTEAANAVAKGEKVAEVANTAAKAGEAGRIAELAEAASLIARNERIALEALKGAENAADLAKATDVFASAQKALTSSDAATSISRFSKLDSAAISPVLDNFGGTLGKAGDIPAEFAGRRVNAVGRLTDTVPAGEAGARILKVPNVEGAWSQELNALWMKEAVNNGDVFRLATEVTETSLSGSPRYGGISVYTRELDMLKEAGYTRVGDFLVPPR